MNTRAASDEMGEAKRALREEMRAGRCALAPSVVVRGRASAARTVGLLVAPRLDGRGVLHEMNARGAGRSTMAGSARGPDTYAKEIP